jgi:hypothetical protein
MKKIIILAIVISAIALGCKTDKHILSNKEELEWSTRGDTILRNNKPVAVYNHLEYELYNGKATIEISIDQIDKSPDNTVSLIKYVHLRHKKNKVEIVVQNK